MLKFYIFSFFLFFPSLVFSLSLDETASLILTRGTTIKADSLELVSLKESLSTTHNLPDFQLDGEFLAAPEGESDRWGTELSWGLEWPGVYGARKNEADKRWLAARQNIMSRRAAKLTDIKNLLLDYIYCTKKLTTLEELKINNDSINKFAETAAKAGEITLIDLNKVKLETANVRAAIDATVNERLETVDALAEICGFNCAEIVEKLDAEFPDIVIPDEAYITRLKKNAPQIKEALAEKEIAMSSKKVALMEALPNISLGYKHAFEDGIHFNGATLGISIPIFSSHNKQKAGRAAIEEAEYKVEATEASTSDAVDLILKRLVIMKKQIEEVKPVIEESNHSELLVRAYEKGLISMIDYLTERNYFTSATLEFLSLQLSAAKSLISLNRFID